MAQRQLPPISILPTLVPFTDNLRLLQERLEGMGFMIAYASGLSYEPGMIFVPLAADSDLEMLRREIEKVRAKFPDTVFAGIFAGRLNIKRPDLFHAGISTLYSLPLEEDLLINKVYELIPCVESEASRELTFDQLTRVSIADLGGASTLSFNLYLYLPMNKKIILYVEKDRPIEEKVLRKFKENPQFSLYIRRSDLNKYFAFCRSLLKIDESSKTPAEISREMAGRLAGLMGGFFNDENISDEDSRLMLENLKGLVAQIPDQSGEKKDLVDAVGHLVSQQMTHLTHSQNVASYCSLFGMALGLSEPETLRIGGLLHDLGLSDLPNDLAVRDLGEMNDEQVAKYKLHPGNGKLSIESKKIKVPDMVLDMVLYHHENPDGSGYPYGKKAAEIPLAAKICAFADEFDKLTSVRPGHRQLSPRQAMRRMAGLDGKKPSSIYEASVHHPLLEMFLDREGLRPTVAGEAPRPTGPRTKLSELFKNPKLMAKAPPSPVADRDLAADRTLAAIEDLKAELREYWAAV